MATPMRMTGTPCKVFWRPAGRVPTGIGLIGALAGEISTEFIGLCLGFAGGYVIYYLQQVPESGITGKSPAWVVWEV